MRYRGSHRGKGNMAIKLPGTREQKEKVGNTVLNLGNRKRQNRKNAGNKGTFVGIKERGVMFANLKK